MVHKNERNKKLNVTKYVHVRAKLFEIQSDKRPDIRGLLPMPTSFMATGKCLNWNLKHLCRNIKLKFAMNNQTLNQVKSTYTKRSH